MVDIFGYHSLQLGVPLLDGLRANRMPYRWLALGQEVAGGASAAAQTQAEGAAAPQRQQAALLAEPVALPFAAASLDLIVLPHTLELSIDPHAALREVERVLVPEGRVVISGMNPTSLWGLRQRRARWYRHLGHGTPYLPEVGELIGYWRLRDWLRLLGFEVESTRFGCYRPAVRSAQWLERFGWMDALGEKWWPILGAAYFLVAVKRVHGMRLLNPAWRSSRQRAATTVPLANSTNSSKNGRGPRRHLDGQEPLASCPCGAGAASDPGGMRTMAVMNHRHGNTA
ncbi:methyltransferase domain-containing protein [Verminephrobacter eiseniae]|nr:methyltransferase domain-containing protein [Verminephrobacter eiseniae]